MSTKVAGRTVSHSRADQSFLLAGLRSGLRAYGFAYVLVTVPELVSILLKIWRRQNRAAELSAQIRAVVIQPLGPRNFPAFCATLVGSYQVLQKTFYVAITPFLGAQNPGRRNLTLQRVARFSAAVLSAWYSLQIINPRRRHQPINSSRPTRPGGSSDVLSKAFGVSSSSEAMNNPLKGATSNFMSAKSTSSTKLVPGRQSSPTIDLCLLAATRASETLCIAVYRGLGSKLSSTNAISTLGSPKKPQIFALTPISSLADTCVFCVSSALVMWAWFHYPDRLPRSYNQWISTAAQVDQRLITVLRHAHEGKFIYGSDTGSDGRVLQSMCRDYGWPEEWGDPEKTCPIPCEVVHMGVGTSCNKHAFTRFVKAFLIAMATNLPLQLFFKLLPLLIKDARRPMARHRRQLRHMLLLALVSSGRSSAFLAAFIALTYYGICLSRTLLGPKIIPAEYVSPQQWDSSLCVATACCLSGCSILIEDPRRRGDLSMFVAPKALGTLVDRRYDRKYFWRERAVFALSTATLLTCAQENNANLVRGWLGKILKHILS